MKRTDPLGRGTKLWWGRGSALLGVLFLLLFFLAAAPASLEGGDGPLPAPRTDAAFLDLIWTSPLLLDPAAGGEVVLDPPFLRAGARYDLLVVGPAPGEVLLTSGGMAGIGGPILDEEGEIPAPAGTPDPHGLRLRVMEGVRPGPASRIQVREGERDEVVIVRWVGFLDAAGRPATFEAVLEPEGGLRAQYLQVPAAFRLPSQALSWPRLSPVSRSDTAPAYGPAEGFRPGPGSSAFWAPRPPDPILPMAVGCGEDENWCVVAERVNQTCTRGARTGVYTPCDTTQATEWHFNEEWWCLSCPYTFYIVVECGTEMHLPFYDMEGVVISITDVFTGVQLELEAINQCARQPFRYCDNCPAGLGSIQREDQTCQGPLINCEPFLQTSSRIAWGAPAQDLDGDTIADELPCGPANRDGCPVGATGSQLAHQNTVTDVMLVGKPGLCGVFRLDFISGGYVWDLFSNCTGLEDPVFNIYSECEDALADFDPLPELIITDFSYSGICPDITLEVEITNIGCADTRSSPLFIDFERNQQDDIVTDLGPIPVSTSVVSSIPVTLGQTPQRATATIDFGDVLFECSEDQAGGSTQCIADTGADSREEMLCACESNARARLADDRVVSCGGGPVSVDAALTTVEPCTGGTVMYRFRNAQGLVIQDWSAGAGFNASPDLCPSLVDYTMDVGCSTELRDECIDSIPFQVECALNPEVEITVSDTDVCGGTTITLEATPGMSRYVWSTGETTRTVQVAPFVTTSYTVDVLSTKGCAGRAVAEVRVIPNVIPPALGNVLRVARQGQDILFDFPPLTGDFGPYDLVGVLPRPCPSPPSPAPTPFIFFSSSVLDSGQPPLVQAGGVESCPDLVFYKVRGTSNCDATPGPLCDGFPAQVLPCP